MEHDQRTVEAVATLFERVSRRAVAIGASLASLAAWAIVAGYIFRLAYYSGLGAPWVIALLPVQDLLASGIACIAAVIVLGGVAVGLRAAVGHADALWTWILNLAWIVPIAVGIVVWKYHEPWMAVMSPVIGLLCTSLSTALLLATVFYTSAIGASLNASKKVVGALFVPLISAMFPWFAGYQISRLDTARDRVTFPLVTMKPGSPLGEWHLVAGLGDKLLLTTPAIDGHRSFRLVDPADVVGIASIGGTDLAH